MNDEPILASRPLLIFNHNPKAGGGSILEVLRGIKPIELKCNNKGQYAESYGSACKKEDWKRTFTENGNGDGDQLHLDETFFNVQEYARTTHFDRVHGFVIGSIREPCSQYLSLWSYGSLGHGDFRKEKVKNPELYGISPPLFNTTDDKNRFWKWMRDPRVVGVVGDRVKMSYSETPMETVDCWVFVEDFRDTLLGCLRMFQDQGGFVDWEAPTVAALLELQQQQVDNTTGHHRELFVNKNNPLRDPRSSHHGKCETMFDEETAEMVEDETESFVYELFGYAGCCKPGTNFYPRTRTASLEEGIEDNHAATATIETLPLPVKNHDTHTTKERAKQHLPASSVTVHSVRVDKLSPANTNSKNNVHTASSKAFESSTFHGDSINVGDGDGSTKVGAVVLTVIFLLALPICRFLWKPRRGAIASHTQQEMNQIRRHISFCKRRM
jgi:hypothetical protein